MNLLAALRYLVALDRHRHFGRAAQACHITQPALSNALRALEREFGVPIVKRSRVYGGLTKEGEVVLGTAQRMLREAELMEQELRGTATSPAGPLRLAAVPTAMPLLARFAALLRKRHPRLTPVVLAMSSQDIEKHLEDLSLDLALGYTSRPRERQTRLSTWPQVEERYWLLRRAAGRRPSKLREGPPVGWADAAAQPLCLLTPDMYNRAVVDAALAAAGAPVVRPAIETNAVMTLALAVAFGDVAAVLPDAILATIRDQPGLEARPLVAPEVRTPVGFLAPAEVRPSRALQAALQLLDDPAWRHSIVEWTHPGE